MFKGEYTHSIDEKGRLIIPSRFREELKGGFVITRGLDGCLSIYPKTAWGNLEEKLSALPLANKSARMITRFLVSAAADCELDRQGRILIPAALREYAKLDRDVVLAGNLERIEVWDAALWKENSSYEDMDAVSDTLREYGIIL